MAAFRLRRCGIGNSSYRRRARWSERLRPRQSAAPGGRCIDRSVDTGHLAGLNALVVNDPEFHPGFGPRADQSIAHELLGYLAAQLGRSPELYRDYSRRPQTRTDHPLELAALRGLRVPGPG
ncbi:MAG: DUF4158 domain-containing protein [Mesorhizobium sp.]|nr:MAG: DUF4158 domain-containing protein [Mesorhizobium sp.]